MNHESQDKNLTTQFFRYYSEKQKLHSGPSYFLGQNLFCENYTEYKLKLFEHIEHITHTCELGHLRPPVLFFQKLATLVQENGNFWWELIT